MKPIIIVGDVLCTSHIQGISRYAYEILKEIDKLLDEDSALDIRVCYPANNTNCLIDELRNIKLCPLYAEKGEHFRKDVLKKYVKRNNGILCNFGPGYCYSNNSIITFHDVRDLENEWLDSWKDRLKLWIMIETIKKRKEYCIVTVSEYQKKRISELKKVPFDRIAVIGNGWEHITEKKPNYSIFDKFANIRRGEYFYSLGSMAKHKNYKWIYEVAKRNPDKQFVVAGNIDVGYWGIDERKWKRDNIVFTGYIEDEESIALMKESLAYVHPSKYEGFGIPPLEALALNKKILISNATCLPEIYENCATYFDPDDYEIDLEKLLNHEVEKSEHILDRHRWRSGARKWLYIFEKYGS